MVAVLIVAQLGGVGGGGARTRRSLALYQHFWLMTVRRSQGDRLDILNLGCELRIEFLEVCLDFIAALVRLPNNRGSGNGRSRETGSVSVKHLCHKKHFVRKHSSKRMQGDGKVLLKTMVDA